MIESLPDLIALTTQMSPEEGVMAGRLLSIQLGE